MFTYVESKHQIHACQKTLAKTISRAFAANERRMIGFRGNNVPRANIQTNREYWYHTAKVQGAKQPNPRFNNWFGRYFENRSLYLNISVEMNVGIQGRNNRLSGFFARDVESDVIYLFHSGRIGGGKPGVGMYSFLAWSGEQMQPVIDSDGNARYGLPVMPIVSASATQSLTRHIALIARFKDEVDKGLLRPREIKQSANALRAFYKEGRGRRKGRRTAEIDYISRHGEIVDALRDWRTAQKLPRGRKIVKNRLIDMAVQQRNKLTEVYEVKSSASRADVYKAIGQLMVHGKDEKCRRIVVLPTAKSLPNDMQAAMDRLGIELLTFRLSKTKAIIG